MRPGIGALLGAVLIAGCPTKKDHRGADQPAKDGSEPAGSEPASDPPEASPSEEGNEAHSIVFADRTSQGYLLLVEGDEPTVPTREELQELVRKQLVAPEDEPEVELLLALVAMPPRIERRSLDQRSGSDDASAPPDLLGLHVDVLPVHSTEGELVPSELLMDPVLTRTLEGKQRASLARRRWAILLRADYRNQYGVRGLRLLQTLVRLVAAERNALIHDPDTGETTDLEAFTQRRLRSSLGNVADQVAVVPFTDPDHPERIRLSTRGMRRFGSVDLELAGLPRDPQRLQKATHLVYGLAYQMVRLGEYDRSGYAVELDDVVTVSHADVVQAYSRSHGEVPSCDGCPGKVDVHLVERPAEPHDPQEHVVARIVAPRSRSDSADYDHRAWAMEAIERLLGS